MAAPDDDTPADPGSAARRAARDDAVTIAEDDGNDLIDVLASHRLAGAVLADLDPGAVTGGFSLAPDGCSVLYTPTDALQTLGKGERLSKTAQYTIVVPGGTSMASLTATIDGTSDGPVAIETARQVFADCGLFITPLIMDPDGDLPTILALVAAALDGDAEVIGGDLLFYDPRGAFSRLTQGEVRLERLEMLVSGGLGGRDTAVGTIRVTGAGEVETLQGIGDADSLVLANLAVSRLIDGSVVEDILRRPGASSVYILRPDEGGHSLWPTTALASGAVQQVRDVERLDFDDAEPVLVSDPGLDVLELLYLLTYQRASDLPGRSFWYGAYLEGMDLDRIAGGFANASESLERYGGGLLERFPAGVNRKGFP
ncbi:MAG: hypothetical protein AAGC57_21320 [Pseudomonadota bacterium]